MDSLVSDLLVIILSNCNIACIFVCKKWLELCTDKQNNIIETCSNIKCNRILKFNKQFVFNRGNYFAYVNWHNERLDLMKKKKVPAWHMLGSTDVIDLTYCICPYIYIPSTADFRDQKCSCGKSFLTK